MFSLLLCFGLGFVFIYFYSLSTSPLYPDFYGGDTAHFMTVGLGWLHGKLPYIDLFDHKGPLIYFIDMVGFAIGRGNKTGIALIQLISMCFFISAVYAISQRFRKSSAYGIFIVILTFLALRHNYFEGNLVEEYCLPWLGWSMYGLLKWYAGERKEHDWRWACLYGASMGICLLTRVTNFAPLVGGIFIICIYLLYKRYFKNFFQNAGAFLVGFFLTIAPFVVYFAIHHGLSQMVYDVLLFNFQYTKGAPSWLEGAGIGEWKDYIVIYAMHVAIFPLIIIYLIKKDYLSASAFLVTALVEAMLYTSGFMFIQYPVVCLMQISLLAMETIEMFRSNEKSTRIFCVIVAFLTGYYLVYHLLYDVRRNTELYRLFHVVGQREWEPLVKQIPEKDESSFVCYGQDQFKEIYPRTGLLPCYRYYVIQDWLSIFDPVIQADMDAEFESRKATWILKDQYYSRYIEILKGDYYVYDRTGNYMLYRKMDDSAYCREAKDMQMTEDFMTYLNKLSDLHNVAVIINAPPTQMEAMTEEMTMILKNSGFGDLPFGRQEAFFGVVANGNEVLNVANEETADVDCNGYEIAMNHDNNIPSIKIEGVERSACQSSIGIVLMNLDTGTVFDSVYFDISNADIICNRIE